MEKQMFIAGFGGQGVMVMAKLIGKASAHEGSDCTFFPEYEPAVRNGASFATVIVSDEPVESCVVPTFDYMVILDNRSFKEQIHRLKPGGYLLINNSLIKDECPRNDVNVVKIPVNDMAEELGNEKLANVIMVGALWRVAQYGGKESTLAEIKDMFAGKESIIALNFKAFDYGAKVAEEQL